MERLKVSQKGRLVVFSQDGEALAEHDIEDTTITIVNEKERESLKLRRLQQKIHKMEFTKMITVNVDEMANSLSPKALALFIKLLKFLEWKTNCLVKPDGTKVYTKDIVSLMDESRQSTSHYIQELVKKGVLRKNKKDNQICWFLNPFIVEKVENMDLDTIKLFKDTHWNRG